MNTKTIVSYSRSILSSYKWRVIHIGRQMLSQKKELLFVFGGRAEHWVGMGSELYRTEKIFRKYIQECNFIIGELGEASVLSNFENKVSASFFDNEANVLFTLAAFQIATFELLKSKGITPNGVMGVSLGEITAIYAAGGISLRDALLELACAVAVSKQEKKEYTVLYLQSGLNTAREVLKETPVDLPVIYEVSEQGVLVFCHKEDQAVAQDFLRKVNIDHHVPYPDLSYPYHTNKFLRHKQLINEYTKNICHKPLQCDFYSSILDKIVPEGTILEPDFWFKLKTQTVMAHAILKQVASAGYHGLLHVGTPSFSEKHLVRNGNRPPQVLNTIIAGQPELEFYKKTERQLLKTKWHTSSLLIHQDEVKRFTEKVSFYDRRVYENPFPYLKYLQNKGGLHYLPRQNEWVVLSYADAEYVIKTPEIFSNTIHKTFDEYLLGADPPSHTVVRSLLQPLFTQQRLNMVAEYTSIKSNELLEQLLKKNKFNLVDEFSIPLSQAIIAKFLGFNEKEALAVKKCITDHPYQMQFFEDLKTFCKELLEESSSSNTTSVAGLLLSFVEEGKLSFDAAISLLRLLWVAGMTTGSILISSAVYLLAQSSFLQSQIRNDEQMLNKLIEECLRLDPPESEIRRITKCETRLGEQILPEGATVIIKLLAANRDPKHFTNPDQAHLDRPTKKHLSFGGGYHFCLGAGMARSEAKMAIKAILEKIPDLKIEEEEVKYFSSQHLRGLGNLPVLISKGCKA